MRIHHEIRQFCSKLLVLGMLVGLQFFVSPTSALANDYVTPWKQKHRAIVIDAYEKNEIDWLTLSKNKRVRAFINKASDGVPSPWKCRKKGLEQKLCKKTFQNFFMKQQIYHTRKVLAKTLGMKWGAYHLGRPGNPIDQANNFIDFADPQEDELIALDIEDNDPEKWMSFEDAEIFVKHIHHRLGRYPVLYTNHSTAKAIALRRKEFPTLSRMKLWYARFKDKIPGVFPMGNWDNYAMWQFSAGTNCNKKKCLMRVAGTPDNIDVNITTMSIDEFDKAWPFNGLVPTRDIILVNDDLRYVEGPRVMHDAVDLVLSQAPAQGSRGFIPRGYGPIDPLLLAQKAEPMDDAVELAFSKAPAQGSRGYYTIKEDFSLPKELYMAEVHHPMAEIYGVDQMTTASIGKPEVAHPLHQDTTVPKAVEEMEQLHPFHQKNAELIETEKAELTYPSGEKCQGSDPFDTTQLMHPFIREYHAALGVDDSIIIAKIKPTPPNRHPLFK